MNIQPAGANARDRFEAADANAMTLRIGELGVAQVLNISSDLSPAGVLRRPVAVPGNRSFAFAAKRAFDIAGAAALIVLLSPVLPVLASVSVPPLLVPLDESELVEVGSVSAVGRASSLQAAAASEASFVRDLAVARTMSSSTVLTRS